MRQLLLSVAMVGILVGCAGGGKTTVISDSPKYSPGDLGYESRAPIKPRQRMEVPTKVEDSPTQWDITDDRFIATHSIDSSVEALKLSPEKIQKRLDELDKK